MGFFGGFFGAAGGSFSTPQLTVLTTFSTTFAVARATPWQATIADFPDDAEAVIIVRYTTHDEATGGVRNETITARDALGRWCWPFDVEPDNAIDLDADPVTLQLFPRGGWPPSEVEIQVAAAVNSEDA